MIRTKDEQLKNAIDRAMMDTSAELVPDGGGSSFQANTWSDTRDLRIQIERLQAEKETVLSKAKQAVEELTSQLAKTRSAREKELERKVSSCEDVINNLKQQGAIDLQVKNFLAERVQELEAPE